MKTSVNISERAYATLVSELAAFENEETGGVFLGYYRKGEWYIAECTFSGPQSEHKSVTFKYDYAYTQYEIQRLKAIYNIDLRILGLWHSHVISSDFSIADDETNAAFAVLNKFGAISAIYDVSEKKLHFLKLNRHSYIPRSVIAFVVKIKIITGRRYKNGIL